MAMFLSYLRVQIKRVLKVLPKLLLVNVVACISVGLLASVFLKDGIQAEQQKKYRFGIVGELADSYLGLQFFQLLRTMDDSRFMMELEKMTEEEASEKLRRGEISAYFRIPEGLVESLEMGMNDCIITYVTGDSQKGLNSILAEEIVDEVSVLITCSQSAVYGMQRLLNIYGKNDIWWDATMDLCLRLVGQVLDRTSVCGMEILGISNGLSAEGYYFCSVIVVYILMAGIFNSSLFLRRSSELPKILTGRGAGALKQIAAEYLAYVFLTLVCLGSIFLLLAPVMNAGYFTVPEWRHMGAEALAGFFVRMIPVAAMLAALELLLYELVTGLVSGIMLQFLCGVAMGYLSGCFYPIDFFPEMIKRVGSILPVGAALRYADGCLVGEPVWLEGAGTILYLTLFLALTVFVRKYRTEF